jgi:hypothetical protein
MRPGTCRSNDIVKEQVAFVKPVIGTGEPDRTAPVLLE